MDQIELGLRIRALRKQHGLSQLDLAVLSGIQSSQVTRIEHGDSNPRLDTVRKIGKGLGLTLGELFGDDMPTPPFDDEWMNTIAVFGASLSEEDREKLVVVVKNICTMDRKPSE